MVRERRAVRLSNMSSAMAGGGRIIGAEAAVSRSPPRSFYATRDRVCRNTALNLASTTPLLLTLLRAAASSSPSPRAPKWPCCRSTATASATAPQGGSGTARTLERLLQKPDDWLGANLVILAAASVFASAIATILAQRTGYRYAVPLTGVAAHRRRHRVLRAGAEDLRRHATPKAVALHAAGIYRVLVLVARPVAVAHQQAGLRLPAAVRRRARRRASSQALSAEELRTVVTEAGADDPGAPPPDAAVDPRPRAASR